jgi:Tol biopolymer transport system component
VHSVVSTYVPRAALVIATVVAVGLGVSGAARGSSQVGPVLVWCPGCHKAGLFAMRPDGTRLRLLLDAYRARWSPRATRIVFESDKQNRPGIWTVQPNGRGLRRLTPWRDSSPSWSPDGRKIVFSRNESQLWVKSAEGGRGHTLVRKAIGQQLNPDWSPRGDRIAFNTEPNYGQSERGLYVVRPDGTGLRRLRVDGSLPRWSPDGRKIAYLTAKPEIQDVWVANVLTLGTKAVRRYRARLNGDAAPVWSPDGKSLLVSAWFTDPLGSPFGKVARLRLSDGHLTVLPRNLDAVPVDWRR